MIVWYFLLTAVSGQPKVQVYATEQQACVDYTAYKASGAKVYKVEGHKDSPVISEGDCAPVQQFIKK